MNVKWYRDSTQLANETYTVDSSTYFCNTQVQAYNKIVITIGNMTKADRFLKIYNISDGISRQFYNDELENCEFIEQIATNNDALDINEATVTLLPKSTAGVLFQRTLPFIIYRNSTMLGHFFVKSSTSNTDKSLYKIKVSDYISILEGQTFLGGDYYEIKASNIISSILGDIPYYLDTSINRYLTGYLPILNKREALREVAFAIGGIVDTSRSDAIRIIAPPSIVSRTIPDSEVFKIETTEENVVTKIEVSTKELVTEKNLEADDIYSGSINGQTVTIIFDSPKFALSITGGTIVSSNLNYAIITGTSSTTTLKGKSYEESVSVASKTNPYVVSTDIEKVSSYETTLKALTPAINHLNFVQYKIKSKFQMRDTRVGDLVKLGGQKCRVMTLNYDAGQTIVICDAELEAYYG